MESDTVRGDKSGWSALHCKEVPKHTSRDIVTKLQQSSALNWRQGHIVRENSWPRTLADESYFSCRNS